MRASVLSVLATFVAAGMACQPSTSFKMTFYGWLDNDPPGPNVAMSCGGRGGKAAGDGSYANPLTAAAQVGRFANCELIYSPYLMKYLRIEDTCAGCSGDWVDVWTGSFTSDPGSGLTACENTLTGSFGANHVIIQSPPSNLQVNTGLLYSGSCGTANVFAANNANTDCTGTGAAAAAVSGAAEPPTVASAPYIPSASPTRKPKHRHTHTPKRRTN